MDVFTQRALSRGEKGKKWLEDIPRIIQVYEKKWEITVQAPFQLSYNYVAPAKRKNGEEVVLKIGFPGDEEFISEIHALKFFGGEGTVKLLQDDLPVCVALLEKLIPGQQLQMLNNNREETIIAADVAQHLWKEIPAHNKEFASLEKWFEAFSRYKKTYGDNGPLPQKIVAKGEVLFSHLLRTTSHPLLIHGDFHHMNILSSGNSWKTIDVKGMVGDPIYDVAVFLYNPLPHFLKKNNAQELVRERIHIFSKELGFTKKRIIDWAIAQSILSALWEVEDKGIRRNSLEFVQLLQKL